MNGSSGSRWIRNEGPMGRKGFTLFELMLMILDKTAAAEKLDNKYYGQLKETDSL